MNYKLCFDIGGTFIKVGLFLNDQLVVKHEIPTEAKKYGGRGIQNKILECVENFDKSYQLKSVGISTAGVVDYQSGAIIFASDNIPDYTGINLKEAIKTQFDIECCIENDVNCALLGEVTYGKARDVKNCLMLTIGTGVGGALLINGSIYHGHSLSAGEVGYILINGQRFEDIASTSALIKDCEQRLSLNDLDGKKIIQLYHQNNHEVVQAIDNFCKNLALGISTCIYLVNPQTILLGGGIMKNDDLLGPIIKRHLDNYLIKKLVEDTTIEFASLDNDAGLYGALSLLD